MKTFFRSFRMLFIIPFCSGLVVASPQAVVQVVDPFDGVWVRNELIDFYVRIVNVGDEIIDISNGVLKTSTFEAGREFSRKLQAVLHLVAVSALLTLPGSLSASAEDFPIADPRTLELEIKFRDTKVLEGESLQYEVILRNGGAEAIPLAVPSAKYGLGRMAGNQLFMEPIWEKKPNLELEASRFQEYYTRPLPARVEDAPWLPVDVHDDRSPARIEWLPAGHELAIPGNRIDSLIFLMGTRPQLSGLRASWLAGPGRWVESEVAALAVNEWDRQNDLDVKNTDIQHF